MQQTLVVVFDNRGDAQKAMEELVACGYPREQLRLSEGQAADDTRRTAGSGSTDDHTFMSGIRHFFSDLFGGDHSESARMYSEAVASGNYVLTLTADSMLEVERAADIAERFGPVDIDEHAALWGGAVAGRAGATQQSAPGSQQFAQPGAVQGSGQRADIRGTPGIQEELKTGKRQVERGGARIYRRDLETPLGAKFEDLAPEDEVYFRGHWSINYASDGGSYEDYASAYTYGSSMAHSDLYRGRPWNDVESHLRGDWEARHPDSAWEKMKAAIRHGWERMTS